jgi:histidine kinase
MGQPPSGFVFQERLYASQRSIVSRALRLTDGSQVILKQAAAGVPESVGLSRFEHELEIRRGLNADYVIGAYGLTTADDTVYLVLEDMGGDSLQSYLQNGPIPLGEALLLANRLVQALGSLHGAGVLHRDINPDNVIYHPGSGLLKISDFDLSSRLDAAGFMPSMAVEGTLAYLSPEQTGRLSYPLGFASDLYSLGVTLFQILSGRLPFESDDPLRLIHCHLAVEPVRVDQINPRVPPLVGDLVARLLAKSPPFRYQTSAGLEADLQECLRQFQRTGWVEEFPLGRADQQEKFEVPSHLYGREAESQELFAAFERVCQGTNEVVLVAGASGVGKSTLIRQLIDPVGRSGGYFIHGKFDQLHGEVPCSALLEALRQLVGQLLTESEERLQYWKERLTGELEAGLPLLVESLPELELIVGAQAAPSVVAPAAAQGRFLATFQQFIQLFSSRKNPLVLFLDDVQWADGLTLHLLSQLAQCEEETSLLLVQAYRDQEVVPGHPFHLALSEQRRRRQGVTLLHVGPLGPAQVNRMVADCLRRSPAEVEELSQIIAEKTEGNPFFLRQFLTTLHRDGHLPYRPELGAFDFDLEVVRGATITDNVASLLAHNLKRLPETSLRVLMLAAALGNRFQLATLAAVSFVSQARLEAHMQAAVQLGLLLPLGGREPAYCFQHDRVQRAAYEAVPEHERPLLHDTIGQVLLEQLSPEQLEDRLFEVVGHLNRAHPKAEQRALLARLNARAGDKARQVAAYDLACASYRAAASFQDWSEDPQLCYQVHYHLAESLRLGAHLAESLEVIERTMRQPLEVSQQAELEALRMGLYQSQGEFLAALDCVRRAAGLLGLHLPADCTNQAEAEVSRVLHWIDQGPVERLLDLPDLQDARLGTLMGVLTAAIPAAYQADRQLAEFITARMVTLSFEHGNSLHSARAYCTFHQILQVRDMPEIAYRFACAGRELNRRRREVSLRPAIEFLHGFFVAPWTCPWDDCLESLRRGYEFGLESGDYPHMSYSATFEVFAALLKGISLQGVEERTESCLRASLQLGEASNARTLEWLLSFLRQLRGLQPWNQLARPDFQGNPMLEFSYLCIELQRAYLSDNQLAARQLLVELLPLAPCARGCVTEAVYYYYRGLTSARAGDLEDLQLCFQWTERCARLCPANFAAPACLLEAELHRLEGDPLGASELYDQAVRLAAEYGLVVEATANELAGSFWLGRGKADFATLYLSRSHRLYLHWGATAKAHQLEGRHGPVVIPRILEHGSCSASDTQDFLNYASLARAAQAISGEIVLDRLLSVLTQVVIENAGAQTGALILEQDGQWLVQAMRQVETGPVAVMHGLPLAQAEQLSVGIVHYVLRTGQSLILDDARLHQAFANESYVRKHAPRSVLCTPIRHKGRLLGVMYLENNLLTSAFHQERLTSLDILLAQVGVSIENARLFAREREQAEAVTQVNSCLEEMVTARTRELLDANERLRLEAQTRERMENELRLAQKLQSVGQLAAGVAHEINTPMQYIQDNLEFVRTSSGELVQVIAQYQELHQMLGDEALRKRLSRVESDSDLQYLCEEVPQALSGALEGVRRVTAIVRAMKEFSYPDQTRKGLVNLNTAIENTLMVAHGEYKLVADVVKDFEPLPELLCFGSEINQVVLNLVVNAAHAIEDVVRGSDQRGTITLATRCDEGHITISVSDTGAGIPAAVQERIFDPFFTTKEVGRGSGQGLAISRSAIARHGGQLTYQTEAGHGTTFTMRLPVQSS